MVYTGLEKPLASKNRILDFAQFQNYKYILISKAPALGNLRSSSLEVSGSNFGMCPESKDLPLSAGTRPAISPEVSLRQGNSSGHKWCT